MRRDSWADAGISLKAEVSTSGAIIWPGTVTNYPFSNPQSGIASGWTAEIPAGSDPREYAFGVSSAGYQSITTGDKTYPPTGNKYYGIYRDFTVRQGTRYIVNVKARAISGHDPGERVVSVYLMQGGSLIVNYGSNYETASPDWEAISYVTDAVPMGTYSLRVYLQGGWDYLAANADKTQLADWGVQYTDVSIQEFYGFAPTVNWRDITCDVQEARTRHGRERFTERFDAALVSVVLNNQDGKYSYSDPHPFKLAPGRFLRLTATYQNTTYPLGFGIIDNIQDGYGLDGRAVTTLTAYDTTTIASNQSTPTMRGNWTFPDGIAPKVLSGTQIDWLMLYVGYLQYAVDAGQFYMLPITASGRSVREQMGVIADSEGAFLFAERDGRVIFKDRNWPKNDSKLKTVTANLVAGPHSEPFVPFSTWPTDPNAKVICPNTLITDWSKARVINYLSLARVGGQAKLYQDTASQAAYGVQTYQRTDYVCWDDTNTPYLDTRANDLMLGQSQARLRVNGCSYRPSVNPDSWLWTLTVFLDWLVRITYINSRNGWGYEAITHIQAIEHVITIEDWLVNLTVDQPEQFVTFTQSIYGWDKGKWDAAKWDDTTYLPV